MYSHVIVAISAEDALALVDAQEAGNLSEGVNIGVLHAAAYPEAPTQKDIDFLYYELMTDERFGLDKVDFVLCVPPNELAEQLLADVNTNTQEKIDSGELLFPAGVLDKAKMN